MGQVAASLKLKTLNDNPYFNSYVGIIMLDIELQNVIIIDKLRKISSVF